MCAWKLEVVGGSVGMSRGREIGHGHTSGYWQWLRYLRLLQLGNRVGIS